MAPIQTSENGRTPRGQFGIGNKAAVGHSSRGKQLRAAMLSAVSEKDVKAVVSQVMKLAVGGDLKAAKMILDLVGRLEGDAPSATPEINEQNFQEVKNAWLAKCN